MSTRDIIMPSKELEPHTWYWWSGYDYADWRLATLHKLGHRSNVYQPTPNARWLVTDGRGVPMQFRNAHGVIIRPH
jgi:hypothetical protein